MKRGHEISVCIDRLVVAVLLFVQLCLALKYRHFPLVLFIPLALTAFFVALNAACKLYNLWNGR